MIKCITKKIFLAQFLFQIAIRLFHKIEARFDAKAVKNLFVDAHITAYTSFSKNATTFI